MRSNGYNPGMPYAMTAMPNQDIALIAHLMRRAGFGAARDELEARAAKGYDATVEELLHPETRQPLDRMEMMRYHPWAWRPATVPGMGAAEWLHDMINTKRPLEEKIALFWHQVFATGVSKVDHYDDVMDMVFKFREKGMGDFRELLLEMARDPAMIYWLDNCENHAHAVNENWGRELLELFSLGVGNYTEDGRPGVLQGLHRVDHPAQATPRPAGAPRLVFRVPGRGPRRRGKDLPGTDRQLRRGGHNPHHLRAAGDFPVHRPAPLQLLRGRRGPGAGLVRDPSPGP